MRENISVYLDKVIFLLLLAISGLTPLLFLNKTTEFFDMPKLILLIVTTVVLYGLWIASWIARGKVVISRTPLDIPLLALLVLVIVSTYLSPIRYTAIYGDFPNVHGSAAAWITYILLYFVTVSNLKKLSSIKSFLYVLYGSAVLVSLITLLSFFNIFLPFDFSKVANFSPTGSSFSTIAFLLLLLPLPVLSLLNPNKYLPGMLSMALVILFGLTIILTGSLSHYIALAIVFGLCVLAVKPLTDKRTLPVLTIPVFLFVVALILAYMPFPGNMVQKLENNFPKEVQLPFLSSWKVSVSTFRDAPFIGTGPASYIYNFATYKPLEFNALNYWNFSFESAYNEFLQILGTLGILGLLDVAFISLLIINASRKNLFLSHPDASQDSSHVIASGLAVSGLIAIVLLAIHATTLVSLVVTFFILAAFMMSQRSIREHVSEFSIGIKATTSDNKQQFDLFPIIIFILYLVAAIPVLYQTAYAIAADYNHRMALAQANKNGTLTYQYLQQAETLNPTIDLYRVDMAQTNFALANAIASKVTTGNATLSDQDKQTIQTLLSQAITEGRVAVALNPRSARNLEVLASIYQNITGVANNAGVFALDAYNQAVQRDPVNPAIRLSIAGIYYSVKNYDMSTRYLVDAINLKPDYTNAYYNLAIALRDKGDLQNAKIIAQQAVTLLQTNKNTQDFKTASSLLDDINGKIGQTPPTAQPTPTPTPTTSALENPNLPNVPVSGLNNPPSVTPAPPVKKNPNAKLPPIVSPTQTP